MTRDRLLTHAIPNALLRDSDVKSKALVGACDRIRKPVGPPMAVRELRNVNQHAHVIASRRRNHPFSAVDCVAALTP